MKITFALSFLSLIAFSCGNTKEKEVPPNVSEVKTITSKLINKTVIDTVVDSILIIKNINTENKSNESSNVNQVKEEPKQKSIVITEKPSETKTTSAKTKNIIKEEVKEVIKETKAVVFTHQKWDELLKKYVTPSGKVNYTGIKSEKTKLETYITQLKTAYINIKSWSKNKQLAFWINTYNASTIKLIVDNYPVNSIKDINGGKPWDKKVINLGGVKYTLNQIENEIIRPKFKEPRIHFAVNCAAKSCPKLLNKAWTEANINKYLIKQTKAFLANSTQNTLTKNKVTLSKIFDWYKSDFIKSGNIIAFIQQYSDTKINDNAKIVYNNYNWSLNK